MAGSFQDMLDALSADPRKRGEQFERVVKWFLESASEYKAQLRRIWLWNDWPGNDGQDIGVDLVGEQHDGQLWAIQAKCWAPTNALPKGEVDKFLSGAGDRFAFRLLVSSSFELGRNAKRALSGRGAAWLLYEDLAAHDLPWPTDADVLTTAVEPRFEPLEHQESAVGNIVQGLRLSDRGQAILPCGTGKTLIGLWCAEALGATSVLLLVPSLSLLSQSVREWTRHSHRPLRILAACSDATVTGDAYPTEAGDLGIPVTSDPDEICTFLSGSAEALAIFGTYQSLDAIAAGVRRSGKRLSLVIADEAHRTTGFGRFSRVTDDEVLPTDKRLFMTATPRIWKRKKSDSPDLQVASMDDKSAYGEVLHQLTFSESVRRNLLADYRVVIMGVDRALLRQLGLGRIVVRYGNDPELLDDLARRVGLALAMEEYDAQRVITYHSRVQAAAEFAEALAETVGWMTRGGGECLTGNLTAQHVSGEMSAAVRRRRLAELNDVPPGVRRVLSNARCLTEGIDIPALDAICFMSPRRSTVEVVQAVGRVMRKHADKEAGTVIIPVFVDEEVDSSEALARSPFETVWEVLRALRSHDSTLIAELEFTATCMARSLPPSDWEFPSRIHLRMPEDVGVEFVHHLQTRLVTEATSAWPWWFGRLTDYVAEHGNALVPMRYKDPASGKSLGGWVNSQRADYRLGLIPQERIDLLEAQPGWVWNTHDEGFDQNVERLRTHISTHGWTDLGSGPGSLAKFLNHVRRQYRSGALPAERVRALEGLDGFVWNERDGAWNQAYEALERFARQNGHVDIPAGTHLPDGRRLKVGVLL